MAISIQINNDSVACVLEMHQHGSGNDIALDTKDKLRFFENIFKCRV